MTYLARTAGLAMAVLFVLVSCSAKDGNPTDGNTTPTGPQIISLGTNVTRLTAGETVRFVAVVTDPTGLANLVGGDLSSPDGAIKYGGFQAAQQGTYSLDLTWDQLQQAQSIDFAAEEQRSFVAQFYNLKGEKATQLVTLQLHCMGLGSWSGRCLAEGSQCATNKVFVMGVCSPGCYVGGALRNPNMINSNNVCQSCQPAMSLSSWSSVPDTTACATGSFCYAGSCAVKFHAYPTTFFHYLDGVWGSSATDVFAVGSAILHTDNGGTTWTEQTNPTSNSLSGVWGSGATNVFAVGSGGTILHSNGGTTWTQQTSRTTSFLSSVWGSSASDVFAVGTDGTILHTSNGGMTWTPQTKSTVSLLGVWGSSAGDVFAVGYDFVGGITGIIHTSNGGGTWTQQPPPQGSAQLRAVWGSSATNVFAVGDAGTIVHTSNGGTTWTKQTSTTTAVLTGVWGSSATDVFAVGHDGTILRTSDGGTTWTKQFSPYAFVLSGVWGSSTTNVFAVGGQGASETPILNNQ